MVGEREIDVLPSLLPEMSRADEKNEQQVPILQPLGGAAREARRRHSSSGGCIRVGRLGTCRKQPEPDSEHRGYTQAGIGREVKVLCLSVYILPAASRDAARRAQPDADTVRKSKLPR